MDGLAHHQANPREASRQLAAWSVQLDLTLFVFQVKRSFPGFLQKLIAHIRPMAAALGLMSGGGTPRRR